MNLRPFKILSSNSDQQLEIEEVTILINLDHIISIKPIKMVIDHQVLEGHWIRTSNGKKYKATAVPKEIESLINDTDKKVLNSINQLGLESETYMN